MPCLYIYLWYITIARHTQSCPELLLSVRDLLYFQPKPWYQILTCSQKAAQQINTVRRLEITVAHTCNFAFNLPEKKKTKHNTGKHIGHKSQQEDPTDLQSCLHHKFYDDYLDVGLLCER